MRRLLSLALPTMTAMLLSFCAATIRPTTRPVDAPPASLWTNPTDLEDRDAFHGPWGADYAPDPQARYRLVNLKHTGVNPGMTVRDPLGREWSVKQAGAETPDEGPVEVTLSRVLSMVGYHQPPAYYLPSFTLEDDWGTRVEPGGRFRLKLKTLKDRGEWSWQQNPFVGTRPLNGLLVMMVLFNNSDIKNSNNTLYEHRSDNGIEHWYVARDLGGALGSTGRFAPLKNNPDAFASRPFVLGIENGYVAFHYHGFHQALVRERITAADLAWASCLLDRVSDRQWQDAFRAGGYAPDVAQRFIRTLENRITAGRQLGSTPEWTPYKRD